MAENGLKAVTEGSSRLRLEVAFADGHQSTMLSTPLFKEGNLILNLEELESTIGAPVVRRITLRRLSK